MYKGHLHSGYPKKQARFVPHKSPFHNTFKPERMPPGTLVRVNNGFKQPAPGSFFMIGWSDYNFVGRIVRCDTHSATVRRPDGSTTVVNPSLHTVRLLTEDESKAAIEQFPTL